jgi:hypothetical protein
MFDAVHEAAASSIRLAKCSIDHSFDGRRSAVLVDRRYAAAFGHLTHRRRGPVHELLAAAGARSTGWFQSPPPKISWVSGIPVRAAHSVANGVRDPVQPDLDTAPAGRERPEDVEDTVAGVHSRTGQLAAFTSRATRHWATGELR